MASEDRPIPFNVLHKDELEYEVTIRGGTPASTATDLRKQIRELNKEFPTDELPEFDGEFETEFATIKAKLATCDSALLAATQKPCSFKVLTRVQGLAYHLYHRVSRLTPPEETEVEFDQIYAAIEKIISKFDGIMLNFRSMRSFKAPVEPETPCPTTLPRFPDSSFVAATQQTMAAVVTPPRSHLPEKYQAVHTLNLTFDGTSCVKGFLQRLEEVRISRGITDERLFQSAPELFTGGALCWYRGAREGLSTWAQLREVLLSDYLPYDYDFRLMKEIRERTQGKNESIVNYLSVMQNCFSQLITPVPEQEKLTIVRHNIRPFYTRQLALHPINDWTELKEKCRLLEQAECTSRSFREPSTSASLITNKTVEGQQSSAAEAEKSCALGAPEALVTAGLDTSPRQQVRVDDAKVSGTSMGGPGGWCLWNTSTSPRVAVTNKTVSLDESPAEWTDWIRYVHDFFEGNRTSKVSVLEEKDTRAYLRIGVYDHCLDGLLDSGSEISILSVDAFIEFKDFVVLHKSFDLDKITTANGSISPVTGYVLLPVTLKGRTSVIQFYVIPDMTSSVLLGIDFWREFGIAPDVLELLGKGGAMPDLESLVALTSEIRSIQPLESFSPCEREEANRIIDKFESISFDRKGLGRTHVLSHKFDTGGADPRSWDVGTHEFMLDTSVREATSFTPFLSVHGGDAVVDCTVCADPVEKCDVVLWRTCERSDAGLLSAGLCPKYERCVSVNTLSRLVYDRGR